MSEKTYLRATIAPKVARIRVGMGKSRAEA